jgi:hypothetical protein
MRKKTINFWILITLSTSFFILPLQNSNAQRTKHALMLWGEAGYSTFHTKWDSFVTKGFGGAGAGFGYNALIWDRLILATGVEYVSLNSFIGPTNFLIYKDLIDTEGDDYCMEYTIRRLSQLDVTQNIFVPFYIGFRTDRRKKTDYYFQVGGKIGYALTSNYRTKVDSYTTIGIYDRFIDPFEEMPNHFFDTKNYKDKQPLNFSKIQGVIVTEIGFETHRVIPKNAIRFSIFADFGIINRIMKQQKDLISFDAQIPNDISVNSLYETYYRLSVKTNSIFAGVKITLLLDVTKISPFQKCISKYGSKK